MTAHDTPEAALHVHIPEYPSACEGCEHVYAGLTERARLPWEIATRGTPEAETCPTCGGPATIEPPDQPNAGGYPTRGWHYIVATADWTGSTKRADAPKTIDEQVEELERIVHPEGRCAVCDGGKPYWKHTANDEDFHAFVPPADWTGSTRKDAEVERLRKIEAAARPFCDLITGPWPILDALRAALAPSEP